MSDTTTTKPETAEAADRPPKTDLKSVRYVGSANVRSISAADLKTAGFVSEDLRWTAENQYTLPVKGIKADVLDLLARDKDFVLE